jgi:hypothetical protein
MSAKNLNEEGPTEPAGDDAPPPAPEEETLARARSASPSACGSEQSLNFQADDAPERHDKPHASSYDHPSRTEGRYDWPTRIGFGVSIGAWLTGLLWMVLRSPLLAVFVTGVALGLYILENCWLSEVARARADGIVELEKQVVSLRSTIHEMSLRTRGLEVEHRRAAFRNRLTRGLSVSSL